MSSLQKFRQTPQSTKTHCVAFCFVSLTYALVHEGGEPSSSNGGTVTSLDGSAPRAEGKNPRSDAFPEAVRLQIQCAIDVGATLPSKYMITFLL